MEVENDAVIASGRAALSAEDRDDELDRRVVRSEMQHRHKRPPDSFRRHAALSPPLASTAGQRRHQLTAPRQQQEVTGRYDS